MLSLNVLCYFADGMDEPLDIPDPKEVDCIYKCFCPKDETKPCGLGSNQRCGADKSCWKGLVDEYYQKIMCNADCMHHCYKSDATVAPSAVTVAPPTMTSGGPSNCILGCLCPAKLNGSCYVGRTEPCKDRPCWKESIKANLTRIKELSCCIHDNCITGEDMDMHDTCSKLEKDAEHTTSATKGNFSVYSHFTQKSFPSRTW